MQPRRNNATFTILVTFAIALGGLVMGLLLLSSGAPAALVVGTLLAAVPVAPLIGCYLWLDRYEPEPRSLLVLGLAWGAFVATSAALFLQQADYMATGGDLSRQAVLVAPVTEEAAKGLFIVLLLWFRRHELDGILDGIVYAGMVGIGFAFTENIIYLASAYMGDDSAAASGVEGAVQLFILRCVFSPFAHPLFTAFIGIGIGIAVGSRSGLVRFAAPLLGYGIAVATHAAWNANASVGGESALGTYVILMVPAFLLVVAFALWIRGREARVLTSALTDAANRGLLDPAEVPWLVRLPGRRILRRNAERRGGPAARRAMVAYQREAIELGYLHHRYLRGTAPRDFAEIGRAHVERMQALRGSLIWPQPTDRHQTQATLSQGGNT